VLTGCQQGVNLVLARCKQDVNSVKSTERQQGVKVLTGS